MPVSALEEVPLALVSLNMPELARFAGNYVKNCLTQPGCTPAMCEDPIWGRGPLSGEQTDVLLVNGQTRPTITMAARRWYRWRLLYASGGGEVIYPELPGCEVGLLAKDGIYLHSAPRPITRGFMAAGNRADWVVRCPLGTFSFNATTRKSINHPEGYRDIASVVATEQGDTASPIHTFSVRRPCYLANLVNASTNRTVVLDGRSMFQFNHRSWAGEHTYEAMVDVGSVIEVTTLGPALGSSVPVSRPLSPASHAHRPLLSSAPAASFPPASSFDCISAPKLPLQLEVYGLHYQNRLGHILHVHVNPFQLSEDPQDTWGGYFQRGDWHDTLKGPYTWTRETPVRLKMALDRFTGAQIVHCHYLWHQDRGMMYMFDIQGAEGRTVEVAPLLQPGCYTEAAARDSSLARLATDTSGPGSITPAVATAGILVMLLLTIGLFRRTRRRSWSCPNETVHRLR